jgi:hypothetical protein
MHWFSTQSLDRFVAGMQDEFDIRVIDRSDYEVSLQTLPSRPTVVVLRPALLDDAL